MPSYQIGTTPCSHEKIGISFCTGAKFSNSNIDWNQGDLKQAAGEAKRAGGDAIILMPKGADPSPTAVATRQQLGLDASQTVAVVVKWK